jgi:hypothetical protein
MIHTLWENPYFLVVNMFPFTNPLISGLIPPDSLRFSEGVKPKTNLHTFLCKELPEIFSKVDS